MEQFSPTLVLKQQSVYILNWACVFFLCVFFFNLELSATQRRGKRQLLQGICTGVLGVEESGVYVSRQEMHATPELRWC